MPTLEQQKLEKIKELALAMTYLGRLRVPDQILAIVNCDTVEKFTTVLQLIEDGVI